MLAKPGDTVTIDWTFRRPTGDAPSITGVPEYQILQGNSTTVAATTMTAVTGTRYTASWATSSTASGEYVVYATITADGLSAEEKIADINLGSELTDIADITKRIKNTVTVSSTKITVFNDGSTSSAAWTQTLNDDGTTVTQGEATT